MSYVSLLKSIPEIISQPIGIAAIASLGIHGAIAMLVPLMPMDSNQPKETASSKTVGLMELSQADQSRLPQSTPQIGLQQLPPIAPLSPPNFSAQTVLPPLAPPPSSQLVIPPLPPSSNSYRVSSLPTSQSLRMIPSNHLRFETPKFNSNKFSNNPNFSSSVPLNESGSKYEPPKLPAQGKLPNLQPQAMGDQIPNFQSQNLSDTTPIATAQGNLTSEMTQPGNDGFNIPENSLINSLKQGRGNGNTLIGTRGSTSQASDLSPKGNQQTIAQLNSYDGLRKQAQQKYPNAEQKSVIREIVATEQPNLEGSVLGVVVVDTDGTPLDIFADKVSPQLRPKVDEYFRKQPFNKGKKVSFYPFNLVFQNNSSNTTGATQGKKPLPLFAPEVNGNQLTPSPAPTSKPLSETPIRTKQPSSLPTGSLKPLVTPGVNNNQPGSLPTGTPKPSSEVLIRGNQPTSLPTSTLQPLSVPKVNSNQLQPFPTATSKPLSDVQINENQPTPTPESKQELLEQLRQLKENREKSNPEK